MIKKKKKPPIVDQILSKERIVKLTVGFGANYIVYIDENGEEQDSECYVSFSNTNDMYVEIKEVGFRHIHVYIPLQKLF